jgi:hypothetical protein
VFPVFLDDKTIHLISNDHVLSILQQKKYEITLVPATKGVIGLALSQSGRKLRMPKLPALAFATKGSIGFPYKIFITNTLTKQFPNGALYSNRQKWQIGAKAS